MYVLNKIHMCNIYIHTSDIYTYIHIEKYFSLLSGAICWPPMFRVSRPWDHGTLSAWILTRICGPCCATCVSCGRIVPFSSPRSSWAPRFWSNWWWDLGQRANYLGELLGDNSSDLSATWLEPLTLVRLVTVLGTLCLSRLQLPGKHHQTMRLKGNGSAKCFWMGQDTWVLWLLSSRAASQSQWIRGVNVADLGLWVMFRPHNFDPDFTAALATISKICNLRAAQKAVRLWATFSYSYSNPLNDFF